jgi:hypothetical protein
VEFLEELVLLLVVALLVLYVANNTSAGQKAYDWLRVVTNA